MSAKLYSVKVATLDYNFTSAKTWDFFVAAGSSQQARRIVERKIKGWIFPEKTLAITVRCERGALREMDVGYLRRAT